MKLLKNVKFGENVICEDSTGSNTFDFSGATVSGGIIAGATISGGTFVGTINATSGGTISGANICGGAISTDNISFASCGGTFCGCGGTINLGSGYLDNAIIRSTCQLSGLTLDYPTVCGGSIYDVTIGGNSTYIYDANICGANLNNIINNYGTISGGFIADVILSGSISNHGTINGGTISDVVLCGIINNYGTISGGVISGSRLEYVSFTCGDTVAGNYATITGINLSGANFNDGIITGKVDVSGNGQIHLYDNNCIDFTSGGWMQMYGVKYTPQISGNQLIFVQK